MTALVAERGNPGAFHGAVVDSSLMDATPSTSPSSQPLAVGTRVRVWQQMPQRDQVWTESVEGVITRYRQAETGSWFAHGKNDRLWLDRLELRLDDGELVVLNLDTYSVIESAV